MTSSNKKIADQPESYVWNAEVKIVERSAKNNLQGQNKNVSGSISNKKCRILNKQVRSGEAQVQNSKFGHD